MKKTKGSDFTLDPSFLEISKQKMAKKGLNYKQFMHEYGVTTAMINNATGMHYVTIQNYLSMGHVTLRNHFILQDFKMRVKSGIIKIK